MPLLHFVTHVRSIIISDERYKQDLHQVKVIGERGSERMKADNGRNTSVQRNGMRKRT